MDTQKKPTKLTLWEEFVALYGNILTERLSDYPVILAKRVTKSMAGLSNRYSTTILLDPTYPEARALHEWAQTIQPLLMEYTTKSTSATGSLLFVPFEEESTYIFDIEKHPLAQIFFYVDSQLILTNQDQHLCSMACSDCKTPFIRSFSSRLIYCINCDWSTMLIPRAQFDITVADHSESAVASVSDKIAENMLHLSVQEIYSICQAKKQSILFEQLRNHLGTKTYKIQMKKLFSRNRDTLTARLAILNYEEKQDATEVTPIIATEATKRKILDINNKPSSSKARTIVASTKKDD